MTPLPPRADLPTHSVENQPPERALALWDGDPVLRVHLAAQGGDARAVADFAQRYDPLGPAGRAANRHPPELRLFDRAGRRLDEVEFHPAYHDLMAAGLGAGYAAIAWEGAAGGHVSHATMVYLAQQVDPGHCCPMTMTYAGVPALQADPELAALWIPRLTARDYDPTPAPIGTKQAATLGMAMTEKQGGSDVRANTTRAEPAGDHYRLTGHKWFCSAPMSDGFLTLAQAPGGLTCFLVPRWLEDGRNAIHIQRLKDKLGNRSNASSEIEYHGALAHRLGDEGAGVRTIIEMVHHTRLDTAVAPVGIMRAALAEALHWVHHRSAFQRRLIDAPLMRAVLADLAVEAEGALALILRVAAAFDDPAQRPLARISVALAKYLNNKLCPGFTYECMEVLGGMGYIDDTPLPMLYREAPLNSIWEGSGNVICLDVLRTLSREPEAAEMLAAELDAARGGSLAYDTALADFRSRWRGPPPEAEARAFTETAARLLGAATLIRHAPPAVADAYAATRLAPRTTTTAGSATGVDTDAILSRVVSG